MRRVYTTGVFDIIHPGHLNLLKEASRHGDHLTVGVQSDVSVRKQKGRYPVMTGAERRAILESLPFVDEVFEYSNLDQRPILKKLKPNVVVQGSDWPHSADRSKIIAFLTQHDIELKLVPYTHGISSTEIKARILELFSASRNDHAKIVTSLAIVPISELRMYERPDPKRVARLVKKIQADRSFTDPVTVGVYNGVHVLIDGANRTEALSQLGVSNILVNKVSYTKKDEVELTNNQHFIDCDPESFLRVLNAEGIKTKRYSKHQARKRLFNASLCAVVECGGVSYGVESPDDLVEIATVLNRLVQSYLGKHPLVRLSESSGDSAQYPVSVLFRKFTVDDIVTLVEHSQHLESGITWHKVRDVIIRVNTPLSLLKKKDAHDETNAKLQQLIEKKIATGSVRYYPSSVYVCDEWE